MEAVGNIKASVVQSHVPEPHPEARRPALMEPRAAEPQPRGELANEVDRAVTEKIADAIQQYIRSMDVKLNFQVHEATGNIMVKVIDEETGDVIREIPPSQLLDLAAKIDKMIGTLFDVTT